MAFGDMALEDTGPLFGIHFPFCHLQHFLHQGNLASSTQYCFEGLPSFQTAPEHPFPLWFPFTNVGRDVQSRATIKISNFLEIKSFNPFIF